MDIVNGVVRQSLSAAQLAAEELAKQANSVAQLATSPDPIGWIIGEEEDPLDSSPDQRPPPLLPVALFSLEPWARSRVGAGWSREQHATRGYGGSWSTGSSSSTVGVAGVRSARAPLGGDPNVLVEEEEWVAYSTDAAAVSTTASASASASARATRSQEHPFVADPELNAKIFLQEGCALSLETEALVVPTAAGYAVGSSTIFAEVLKYGGSDLRADVRHLETCRSGEARITKAYSLPAQWVLLTVGPKYKEKYHMAAQNTLNACYRECFHRMFEKSLRTLCIPCVWYNSGYPPEEQAHVALRTVRRCLEKMRGAIDCVVFVGATTQEERLYNVLLPLYFPRTVEEALANVQALPDGCWSEWGDVAVEERRIPIAGHLTSAGDEGGSDDDRGPPLFSTSDDGDRGFLNYRDEADGAKKRLETTMNEAESTEVAKAVCLRYLRRAREMATLPECSRFAFRAGQDRFSRQVVVLLGARLPSLGVRDERTLPLFVKELEVLRGQKFVILYVNSDVSAFDTSKLEVLQEMVAVICAKYRGSMEQLIVFHPGFLFRAAFVVGRAVSDLAASIWHDTIYVEGLSDLASWFMLDQLQLPEYVRSYDLSLA